MKLRELFSRGPKTTDDAARDAVGDARAPGSSPLGPIAAELIAQISKLSPDGLMPEDIDPEVHMFDAGYLNSMNGAELLMFIEERYALHIEETDLVGQLHSVDALAAHISAHGGVGE